MLNTSKIEQNSPMHKLELDLARFSYKPGFKFRTHVDMQNNSLHVILSAHIPERDNPLNNTIVQLQGYQFSLEDYEKDPDCLVRELQHLVNMFESHEQREWLRCDGILVDDPHGFPYA